jgi:hypothetical protein
MKRGFTSSPQSLKKKLHALKTPSPHTPTKKIKIEVSEEETMSTVFRHYEGLLLYAGTTINSYTFCRLLGK